MSKISKTQIFKYRVENFCAVNKFTLGGVAVTTGSLALALHFLQRGLNEAHVNKGFADFVKNAS